MLGDNSVEEAIELQQEAVGGEGHWTTHNSISPSPQKTHTHLNTRSLFVQALNSSCLDCPFSSKLLQIPCQEALRLCMFLCFQQESLPGIPIYPCISCCIHFPFKQLLLSVPFVNALHGLWRVIPSCCSENSTRVTC